MNKVICICCKKFIKHNNYTYLKSDPCPTPFKICESCNEITCKKCQNKHNDLFIDTVYVIDAPYWECNGSISEVCQKCGKNLCLYCHDKSKKDNIIYCIKCYDILLLKSRYQ